MARPRKVLTPKQRGLLNGYRSGLEDIVSEDLAKRGVFFAYERAPIRYTRPVSVHRYTGDWIVRRDKGEITYDFDANSEWYLDRSFWEDHFLIESKGYFEPKDRKKHLLIQAQYPMADIRFLFDRSSTPIRKGSPTTYASWCEAHDFLYADKFVPDDWFNA